MKAKPPTLIYTVLADNNPIVALEAKGPEARELLKERWFLAELSSLKVKGEPIYRPGVRLRARPAKEEEWAVYDREIKFADDADVFFVYLVDLDAA